MSIRIALLDLGNVLVNVDPRAFAERAAEGTTRSVEEILARYDKGERKHLFESGKLAPAEFFGEMAEWLGRPSEIDALKQAWVSVFSPLPGAEAAVTAIEHAYTFWILSDTDPVHLAYLREQYPYLNRVGRLYASFETGLRKTDERIFQKIIAEAACNPAEILFVDDKAEHVALARAAGMTGIVFSSWLEVLEEMNVSGW